MKLYSSTSYSAGISFNLLHGKCGSRLKQQYICPQCNETVDRDQMVKGYEFSKGQYVTFSTEELKALEETASEAIEITEFVKLDKVDPVFYDKAYYLGPDRGGDRAYLLLAEAMRETGRCAIAKYAARGKMYIVILRPAERGIVMQTLRYADEVKPMADVPLPEAQPVKENELKLAKQLIESIGADAFRPEQYEDEVTKRTEALIQKKIEGQDIREAPVEAPQAKIIDLMEALKASLGQPSAPAARAAPAPKLAPAPPPVAAEDRKGPKRATGAKSGGAKKASKE